MRTNIDIDDKLMKAAMQATGSATKKGTVEEGLRLLVKIDRQTDLRKLRGTLDWDGDLDEMRQDA